MHDDNVKGAWQEQTSQTRLTFNADTVLKEVQRNQQHFDAIILRRDQIEIGVGILLVPIWIVMGWKLALPWTWYLTIPGLLWVAGFMLFDRRKNRQRLAVAGDSLRDSVQSSLTEVEHQIWLLRNVVWWYLLPIALPILAFMAQVCWKGVVQVGRETTAGGLLMAAVMACIVSIVVIVFIGVYRLNLNAVRRVLEPRQRELQAFLASLNEEPSSTNK